MSALDELRRSYFTPFAHEIMVDSGQLRDRGMVRLTDADIHYCIVKFKQQTPFAVISDHALNPKE